MAVRTLGQERAQHAWEAVQAAKEGLGGEFKERFATPAKKMPARVRTSGLGQTVAFMRLKEGAEVVKAVADWCRRRGLIGKAGGEEELLERFRKGTAADVRQLTAETLAYLEWLVRFADGAVE
jgi:CRISPR-associated protein Cmr5